MISLAATQKTDSIGMECHFPTVDSDVEALNILYEQFRRPIHSYVYRLLGNLEDADDITQEVFVRVCTAWDGLYERDKLSSWLYRIASNLCIDLMRRRKRIAWYTLTRRGDNDGQRAGIVGENTVLLSDCGGIPEIAEREHIRLALANMPAEYATVLVLNAAQGVSYREVATLMSISPSAAATRISRARHMFKEQYQRLSKESDRKPGKLQASPAQSLISSAR